MRSVLSIIIVSLLSLCSNADQRPLGARVPPEPLMTVTIRPSKLKFKVGEIIYVVTLLQAGKRGVYLSKMSGDDGPYGLFLDLTSLENKSVLTCGSGSSGADRVADPDAEQTLNSFFIFLKPNGIRRSRSSLRCVPKLPGKYLIKATYTPMDPATQNVATLPKTKGLVLRGVVAAKPVEISIE
jgi:hypothetical protein